MARLRSVLEPIYPHPATFQARAMARGEPGLPAKFEWRGKTYVVLDLLDSRRETENERGTSSDGYVRRHAFRVRVDSGEVMILSGSRGSGRDRWVLRSIEESD